MQTDCFCLCYKRDSNSDSGIKQLLDEVKKVSAELKELKSNITGKTATKLMAGIFPIRSDVDLNRIDYNMENTENFQFRLVNNIKHFLPFRY